MRVFIALELPDSANEMLCTLQEKLLAEGAGGRCVARGNFHLTLRFLGEMEDMRADAVCQMIRQRFEKTYSPMISIDGIGAFVRAGGDTLYARLGGDVFGVHELEKRLSHELSCLGIPQDIRPFTPHITLLRSTSYGRVRHVGVKSQPFFFTDITVYQSILGGTQSTYVPLCRIPLVR